MATRATYCFHPAPGSFRPKVTFYIHYDGYPSGAADYFQAMLDCPNKRGGLADQFIRANECAELTGGHDVHGDTEYRYDVIGRKVRASRRVNFTDRWEQFFDSSLEDFLAQYRRGDQA